MAEFLQQLNKFKTEPNSLMVDEITIEQRDKENGFATISETDGTPCSKIPKMSDNVENIGVKSKLQKPRLSVLQEFDPLFGSPIRRRSSEDINKEIIKIEVEPSEFKPEEVFEEQYKFEAESPKLIKEELTEVVDTNGQLLQDEPELKKVIREELSDGECDLVDTEKQWIETKVELSTQAVDDEFVSLDQLVSVQVKNEPSEVVTADTSIQWIETKVELSTQAVDDEFVSLDQLESVQVKNEPSEVVTANTNIQDSPEPLILVFNSQPINEESPNPSVDCDKDCCESISLEDSTNHENYEAAHDNLDVLNHLSQQSVNSRSNNEIESENSFSESGNTQEEEKLNNSGATEHDSTLTVTYDNNPSNTSVSSEEVQNNLIKNVNIEDSIDALTRRNKSTQCFNVACQTSEDTCFETVKFNQKMTDENHELRKENSELKLQLNAAQQALASLELEIRQKEEIIIKTQAESLNTEQMYKVEIKQLKEKLKENSEIIDKSSTENLEQQLKEMKDREAKAIAEANQRIKEISDYEGVLEKFETKFAVSITEYKELKEEYEVTKKHLTNLELAFSDLHAKYEKVKEISLKINSNNETLKKDLEAAYQTYLVQEERYEALKSHAQGQLDKANRELHLIKEQHEAEVSKLKALVKFFEIKCKSLEVTIVHKDEENKQLSALCDEVTGKKL